MKRTTYLLIAISISCDLAAQVSFEKTFLTPDHEHVQSATALRDSSLIVAGYADQGHSYLIRLNEYGDTLWTRAYNNHAFTFVTESHDGAIIAAGRGGSQNVAGHDLMKISTAGQILWHRAITSASTWTYANLASIDHVARCSDKGFLLTGYEKMPGYQKLSASLRKTDSVGNLLWSVILLSAQDNYGHAALELNNGDVMVCGGTSNPSVQILLFKVDGGGALKWVKRYGNSGYNLAHSLTDGGNGHVYLAGAHDYSALLLRIDTAGNIITAKTYLSPSGDSRAMSVSRSQNQLLLAGYTGTTSNYDALLFKTDLQCDTIFTRKFGGSKKEFAVSVAEQPAGGYFLGGEVQSTSAPNDFIAIGTDTLGRTSCSWSVAPMTVTSVSLAVSPLTVSVVSTNSALTTIILRSSKATTVQTICAACIPPAAPLDLTPAPKKVFCAGKAATLTASGTGTLTWHSTSTSTAAVATGTVFTTATLSPGQYTFFVQANACTSSISRTAVTVTVTTCAGLGEYGAERMVSLFPNPFSSSSTITFAGFVPDLVQVHSLDGKCLRSLKPDSQQITVHRDDLPAGLYFLKLSHGTTYTTVRLIIAD